MDRHAAGPRLRGGARVEVGAGARAGKAAVYGDLDFIALGALVEVVAHQPLDAFCEERIFAPLEMRDTFFVPLGDGAPGVPPTLRQRIAATENCPWRDRVLWGEVHDPNASVMGGIAGHAGLFSTADDVMKFALALIDVWHGRSDLWPRELVREFTTRQKLPEASDWAIGWDHADRRGVFVRAVLLRELGRPSRFHRHLAVDRLRRGGGRRLPHQPLSPGREVQPLRAPPGRARSRGARPSPRGSPPWRIRFSTFTSSRSAGRAWARWPGSCTRAACA